MSISKKLKSTLNAVIIDELTPTLLNSPINFFVPAILARLSFMRYPALMLLGQTFSDEHSKIPLYFEEWIDRYIDFDFFKLFRMTRITFSILTKEIGNHVSFKTHFRGKVSVPLEKCVLITLWYLGKGDTFINIGDRFNITISTVSSVTHRVMGILVILRKKFICWPTIEECVTIADNFLEISQYPGVIGAIDGCHINCKVPIEQHDSYLNRKKTHSIILQGVCTYTKLFTYISVGFPGSVHDARVLKESSMGKSIRDNGFLKWFYTSDYHLLGDSAYPLEMWLMTPYRNANITRLQRIHNKHLSRGRVAIENTFGLLKGRWRILKYVNVYKVEVVVDVVVSCCVLHNFCIINKDSLEEKPNILEVDVAEEVGLINRHAQQKRDKICLHFE